MTHTLEKLPYELDALVPHMSKETLEYHYGKHHAGYVTKLNSLVDGTPHAKKSLEELVMETEGPIFNNAAQVWNHTFFWKCLSPKGGGKPSGNLAKAIEKDFGSFEKFKTEFSEKAVGLFGAGWTWLAKTSDHKLEIVQTSNAQNPMTLRKKPLLTCDVWEHAYYIDHRNLRPKYLEAYWALVNWEFVEKQL